MIVMGQNLRIKLTKLIEKLPEAAVSSLLEQAESYKAAQDENSRPSCPYCGNTHIVKNGHKCGKQEYRCKDCGRTYVSTTKTIMSGSHQSRELWEEVISDTLRGNAIEYSAKRLGLSHDCVFHMRHKILFALQEESVQDPVILKDVAELDETYVLESYKGKTIPDEAGRKARKHGAKAQKRGISSEYICICTGIERKGSAFAASVNRARPSIDELKEVFTGHIADETLVLCDGLHGYSSLEEISKCSVKDVTSEPEDRFYNLNTVNGYHSFIKKRYNFYKGVATKFLNRYNVLFSLTYGKPMFELVDRICEKLLTVTTMDRVHPIHEAEKANLLWL
jgi:transposase-like protein